LFDPNNSTDRSTDEATVKTQILGSARLK